MHHRAVLAELLAVISGDHHEGVVEEATLLEVFEQQAELHVERHRLAVVEGAQSSHLFLP